MDIGVAFGANRETAKKDFLDVLYFERNLSLVNIMIESNLKIHRTPFVDNNTARKTQKLLCIIR